jgi:hypothetical protein
MLTEIDVRKAIEIPIHYLLVTRWLNGICRSNRVRKLHSYKTKSFERLETAIDVQ